ncbi:MAG: LPXTG cell wall anchor domain-containing protein [Rubrobacteraceae bacterium]
MSSDADSAASSGSGGIGSGILPSTGGPLLPLLGLGAVALGATGLLARNRRHNRQ